jgi:hypothetical protein
MSLMTDTQGTPERVWSLVGLLRAHDGELGREAIKTWLDPFGTDTKGTAIQNTIGAGASLDLIEPDRAAGTVRLVADDLPDTLSGFADRIHGKLVQTPLDHANSVVLEAYAWFVATCAREKGTTWIERESADSLTERIRVDLTPEGEEGRFNKTRYPRWRDWIGFMGLGLDLPIPRGQSFYPSVTTRLDREMAVLRERFGTDAEISAENFLTALTERMPYLDGGELFQTATKRIRWSPPARQLSIVLSTALRDLDDDGVLELKMYGDAPNAFTLHPDPTQRKRAFIAVRLMPTEDSRG